MFELTKYTIKGQSLEGLLPTQVLQELQVFSYEKNEAIALAGQTAPYLFVVLSGQAAIKQLSAQGGETILGYVYAGDLIGELEVYTHCDFLHYVYAESSVELLAIPEKFIHGILADYVPFLRFVMDNSFAKLLNRTTYFSDTRLYGHQTRMITYILDLVHRLGGTTVPFVLGEVAPFIGVSERQLRRIIKELEARNLLKKGYKTIQVLNEQALAKYLQETK